MKNVEIKKALQNDLKYYDNYEIYIWWWEDSESSWIEVCGHFIEGEDDDWTDSYSLNNIPELLEIEENLTDEEIKVYRKEMRKTYNYLKKHFDNVILKENIQYV